VAWLVVLVALVLALPVLWLKTVDEAAVPSASDAPSLPAGVTVGQEEVLCGSGGCYRMLWLSPRRGQSHAELAERVGLPHQNCRARSLLDRRHVCSHLEVSPAGVAVVVQFDRSAWF